MEQEPSHRPLQRNGSLQNHVSESIPCAWDKAQELRCSEESGRGADAGAHASDGRRLQRGVDRLSEQVCGEEECVWREGVRRRMHSVRKREGFGSAAEAVSVLRRAVPRHEHDVREMAGNEK